MVSVGDNDKAQRKNMRVVRRQYVITNCLSKEFHTELFKLIKNQSASKWTFDQKLFA